MFIFLFQTVPPPCIPTVWYKDPTTIIAAATIVYVVATILLWWETRRSVNITRDSFENSFMPIIHVPSVTPHPDTENTEFAFSFMVKNYGNVPAAELEPSVGMLADGIPLSPRRHETGLLFIPPYSDTQIVFILIGEDKERALRSGKLDLSFSALYEGIAEKKYRYDYKGAYYPNQNRFVDQGGVSTPLGKPKKRTNSAATN